MRKFNILLFIFLLLLLSFFGYYIFFLIRSGFENLILDIPNTVTWLGLITAVFFGTFPQIKDGIRFRWNLLFNKSIEFNLFVDYTFEDPYKDTYKIVKSLENHLVDKYTVNKFYEENKNLFHLDIEHIATFQILLHNNGLYFKHSKLKIGLKDLLIDIEKMINLFSHIEEKLNDYTSIYSGKLIFNKNNPYLNIYISELDINKSTISIKDPNNNFELGNNFIQYKENKKEEFIKLTREKLKLGK